MKLRMSLALTTSVLLVLPVHSVRAQSAPRTERRTPTAQRLPREQRPEGEALKLPNLPEVPDKVLQAWANATAQVKKMDGKVRRIEYENVFRAEKHSEGKFWFEAPDKGKLALKGLTFAPGARGGRFALAPGDSDEWICTGREIYQIDRELKQGDVFPIPKDAQGANIMHGPLPFLFGMPPNVAKQRYWLFLKKQTATTAQIVAYPKWAADRQNYQYAQIILLKKNFLPSAVMLKGPGGNTDTVYTFEDVTVNRPFSFAKPFQPETGGVTLKRHDPAVAARPEPPKAGAPPAGRKMPSFVGLHGRDVVQLCKKLQVEPKLYRGVPAANEKLVHRAYKQSPSAETPLRPGQIVQVTLYVDPKSADED